MTAVRRLPAPLVALAVALLLAVVAARAPEPAPASPSFGASATAEAGAKKPVSVLVFSRTVGYRHGSIPVGIATIRQLGAENGFAVEATEDPAAFNGRNLRRHAAVIFLNTVGNVLDEAQQRAMKRYIKRGGGYVGIHAAADTEHDWPFYGGLVGARFKSHPLQQTASFDTEARRHIATRHLPTRFTVFDEFYSFNRNPRPYVRVLLSIDEDTYSPDPNTTHLPGGTPSSGVMGDHPMAWCHSRRGGRTFYTALGHEPHLYALEWFRKHLLAGILYSTRQLNADCRARPPRGVPDD